MAQLGLPKKGYQNNQDIYPVAYHLSSLPVRVREMGMTLRSEEREGEAPLRNHILSASYLSLFWDLGGGGRGRSDARMRVHAPHVTSSPGLTGHDNGLTNTGILVVVVAKVKLSLSVLRVPCIINHGGVEEEEEEEEDGGTFKHTHNLWVNSTRMEEAPNSILGSISRYL